MVPTRVPVGLWVGTKYQVRALVTAKEFWHEKRRDPEAVGGTTMYF